ncbi:MULTISPECIES: PAS domain-containing sensor histidine kinase [Bacillaceae]|uniref:histidine kinase n=1 Tax=Alkalicoccobacillus plakortidis TaxID=444060 RepID=A0A9D5I2X4_9BACI|nr:MULTISPECIES: PAS domain-containing sensor histidine kinase [Bacillaceae]KQL59140.1 histidine kinase [Alkalicoccobacillus plakortidis]
MSGKRKMIALFIGVSLIWVIGTDYLLLSWEPELYSFYQKIKGIFFIIATSVFIYVLLTKSEKIHTLTEEKEKVETLINSIPDFISFKDGDGRWIQSNTFALELFQIDPIDYIGKTNSQLAEEKPFFKKTFLLANETDEQTWTLRKTTRHEAIVTLENGEQKIFDTTKTPLFTESGERKALIVVGRDITERMKAKQRLEESELRYKALFDHSPELVYMVDLRGNITDLNPHFMHVTGYDRVASIGEPFISFVDERDHVRLKLTFYQVITSREVVQCNEIRMKHQTGKKVIVNCASLPVIINGELVGITGYAHNITPMMEAEEKLRTTEKLAVVGELAAGIAHEIRNPLTSLRGFVQLFQAESKEENPIHRIMLEELERINMIASELLILSRPHDIFFSKTNVTNVLSDVIHLLTGEAKVNGVSLSFKKPCPFYLYGDKNQLKQLFINVIKNAIEASASTITVSTLAQDGRLKVKVEDDGHGISEERMARLGEPFFSQKDKGTGLGLTVSYKIVEQHKGNILYESAVGEGTIVHITFPLVKERLGQK